MRIERKEIITINITPDGLREIAKEMETEVKKQIKENRKYGVCKYHLVDSNNNPDVEVVLKFELPAE